MNLFCLELQVDTLMNFMRFLLSYFLSLLRSLCIGLWLGICCSHHSPKMDPCQPCLHSLGLSSDCCSFSQVIGSNLTVMLDTSVGNQRSPAPAPLLRIAPLLCRNTKVQDQVLPVKTKAKKALDLFTASSSLQHTHYFTDLPFAGSRTCRIPLCEVFERQMVLPFLILSQNIRLQLFCSLFLLKFLVHSLFAFQPSSVTTGFLSQLTLFLICF